MRPKQVQELGRGQFGSVWLARWRGVEVALKELHGANSPRSRAEMVAEARTLAGLRHPCVIAIYGVIIGQVSTLIGCVGRLCRIGSGIY